jgi:nicotinate-nucleotide adenylyltransferase
MARRRTESEARGPARVGIFGGTFDPPHIGHLVVADDAAEALDLEEIWFIPAGSHPLKGREVVGAGADRWAMLLAAIQGKPRFRALDVELRRPGPSYSVDTLRELRAAHPDTRFAFLVGADVVSEFHKWREPETIARLADVVVLSRGENGSKESKELKELKIKTAGAPGQGLALTRVRVTRVDLSSTEVRRRVREGRPFRYLVPHGVDRIILERGLYRSGGERKDDATRSRGPADL